MAFNSYIGDLMPRSDGNFITWSTVHLLLVRIALVFDAHSYGGSSCTYNRYGGGSDAYGYDCQMFFLFRKIKESLFVVVSNNPIFINAAECMFGFVWTSSDVSHYWSHKIAVAVHSGRTTSHNSENHLSAVKSSTRKLSLVLLLNFSTCAAKCCKSRLIQM